jgi:hypothetical protein
MHRARPIEVPPPRTDGGVSPWIEVSAWILAFAILLAAQCAPERATSAAAGPEARELATPRGDAPPAR